MKEEKDERTEERKKEKGKRDKMRRWKGQGGKKKKEKKERRRILFAKEDAEGFLADVISGVEEVGNGRRFISDLVVVDEHLDSTFRFSLKELNGLRSRAGRVFGIRVIFSFCVGVVIRFRCFHRRAHIGHLIAPQFLCAKDRLFLLDRVCLGHLGLLLLLLLALLLLWFLCFCLLFC